MIGCGGDKAQQTGNRTEVDVQSSESEAREFGPRNEFGFAKVIIRELDNYQEGIVDAQGTEVVQPSSKMLVNDISGQLALVQVERKFLFVPLDQGFVSAKELEDLEGFQYAEPYRCGLALVIVNDARFYLDANFERAFDGYFEFAESFHHDRALAMNDGRFQIIDTEGEVVADLDYDQVNPQSPWCWQVTKIEEERYRSGFVDLNGDPISELIYDYVGYYDPAVRRIPVARNELHGFLDEHAKVVIPVIYEYAEVFEQGKAKVALHGRTFFIDPNGTEVPD